MRLVVWGAIVNCANVQRGMRLTPFLTALGAGCRYEGLQFKPRVEIFSCHERWSSGSIPDPEPRTRFLHPSDSSAAKTANGETCVYGGLGVDTFSSAVLCTHIADPRILNATMNTGMATTSRPLAIAQHIPIEVCEDFIDMLYSPYRDFSDELENFAALRSCALVCRAWRIRAQRMLFYAVHLNDVSSLYRFAEVLLAGPHLCPCVHEVTLISRSLHTTASILSSFPAVFAGKLPNLQRFRTWRISESDTWYPKTLDPPKAKSFPHIPLHPHFPVLLASFATLSTLQFAYITFRSFREFAQIIYSLPAVETLMCHSVAWTTLGTLPAFLELTDTGCTSPRFAPKLRLLKYFDSSVYGAQRLISACGSHLSRLWISFPMPDSLAELEANKGKGINLSSCLKLQRLTVRPTAEFSTNQRFGDLLQTMLSSWKTPQSHAQLAFGAWYQTCHFTRQGYADILAALGTVTNNWLNTVLATATTEVSVDTQSRELEYRVLIRIYDWESRREWWMSHINAAFPTWAQLGRLELGYLAPSTPRYQWKRDDEDEDQGGGPNGGPKCTLVPNTS